MAGFAPLALHDATLLGVEIAWATREVQLVVRPAATTGTGPGALTLRWTGCSRVVVPMEAPWGRSASIGAHGCDGRRSWIELQSGDVVEIEADGFGVA